jgi:protein TonB
MMPERRLHAMIAFSLATHAVALVGIGVVRQSLAELGRIDTLEVFLAPAAEPASRSATRTPAAVATASAAPAAESAERATDEARVEARHDVAGLNNPKPHYPLAARRRGLEGRVVIAAHVGTDGLCHEANVRRSSGHELLDTAARDSVRRWRFIPARRGDTPVDSWVDVPVTFRLDS